MTRDQIRELPPPQQELVGEALVQRLLTRDRLLSRARQGMTAWTSVYMGAALAAPMSCISFPRITPIAIILSVGLSSFLASRLHRRMDAVLELIESSSHDGPDQTPRA